VTPEVSEEHTASIFRVEVQTVELGGKHKIIISVVTTVRITILYTILNCSNGKVVKSHALLN
jgi:hypothetical protein